MSRRRLNKPCSTADRHCVEPPRKPNAWVSEPVAREPDEPLSPEIVLVCPELGTARGQEMPEARRSPPERTLPPPLLRPPVETVARRAPTSFVGVRCVEQRSRMRPTLGLILGTAFVAWCVLGVALWTRPGSPPGDRVAGAIGHVAPRSGTGPVRKRHVLLVTPAPSTSRPTPRSSGTHIRARPAGVERRTAPAPTDVSSDEPPATRRGDADSKARSAKAKPGRSTVEETDVAEVEPSGLPGIRMPTGPLFAPDSGQHVVTAPPLAWDPVANATGYRLRVYRNGTLVFDAVTRELGATLGRRWRFRSREVTLSAGTYRWYVWPIPQNARRPIGPLLKASWFRVVSHQG